MEIIIQPDRERASDLAARLIQARLRAKPDIVLGLATGRTMERVYTKLAAMHRRDGLDFRRCRTFNLDEYVGLAASDEHSYRYYMNHHLFDRVDVDIDNTHLPDGMAQDVKAEARGYEALIEQAGGIDLQLLGIGESGHIGFNEPLSAFRSRTRDKALTPTTRRQNAPMFGNRIEDVPERALTMGVGTILDARELLVLVTGSAKAAILAKAVEGPIAALVSASALQLHANCKVVVDEDAAAELKGRDDYVWMFENEPEWAAYR
ncbi:MAG: glucosamine-6-phosphate deaminase [Alphaproteobacteria bacterium]|nr:glucosamine-6-phosphate deaminase [Alphaproteobacteria bacterium]